MTPSSDFELVERARAGDEIAWRDLVRLYHPRIAGLCLSLLRDSAQADDAAQDSFIKAFESLDSFHQDSSFSTWLHRIAVNRCLDLLRKRKRLAEESWDALIDEQGDGLAARLAGASDPQRVLENADLAAKILARLPANYRAALVLREASGLSYAEIAEVLDCSLDSVKAVLRRARAELHERLRHFLDAGSV